MPLSDIETAMAKIVVDRFVRLKEPTSRKFLVTKFRSIEAVDRLMRLGVLSGCDNHGNLIPSALGIECAGSPEALERAKKSVGIVLSTLQDLYDITPAGKQISRGEVSAHALKLHGEANADLIDFGLCFLQEFPVLDSYGGPAGSPASGQLPVMEWMTISERIVAADPKTAWDEHIKRRRTALDEITRPARIATSESLDVPAAPGPLVLISHSSKDVELASALIDLLRAALPLSAKDIVCSSVDGYRLPLGVKTDEQLRATVTAVRLLVGLLTPSSLSSTYVLFELGARWGADLPMIPLWAGVHSRQVEGPIKGVNAASCSSEPQLIQLVEEVGSLLGLKAESAASYLQKLRVVKQMSDAISDTTVVPTGQEEMIFEETVYWKNKNGQREGPYCPNCYEAKGKVLHLQPGMTRGTFGCTNCRHTFRTGEYSF